MILSVIDLVSKIPEQNLNEYAYVATFLYDRLSSNKTKNKSKRKEYSNMDILDSISLLIEERLLALSYIDELPEDEVLDDISNEKIDKDNKEIELIFNQALANRCYGVKNGAISQESRNGLFIFADIENIKSQVIPSNTHELVGEYIKNALAYVMDTPETYYTKNIKKYVKDLIVSKDIETVMADDVKKRNELIIKNDGSLTSAIPLTNSLEVIARDKGRYISYRKIQAEILANFIDLVTPLENSEKVHRTVKRSSNSVKNNTCSGADIVSKLLIPRIKAASDMRNSRNNSSSTNENNQKESKREVKLHGVIWHIRQLPKGWHASPDAVAMAEQAGITLDEGETFVRPHQRGSKKLGEIAVHMLIKRP